MEENLKVMMKLRIRCIRNFDHNRKFSSQMVSKGLRTTKEYALKTGGAIMLSNNTLCICHVSFGV